MSTGKYKLQLCVRCILQIAQYSSYVKTECSSSSHRLWIILKYQVVRPKIHGWYWSTTYSLLSIFSLFLVVFSDNSATKSKSWLQSRCEPWDEVISHWKNTFILRRNSKSTNVFDFCQEWPIIKKPKRLRFGEGLLKFYTVQVMVINFVF